MTIDPLPPRVVSAAQASSGASQAGPEKVRAAAAQFEALLIGQILKSAHEGPGQGWLGTEEDQTMDSTLQLGDEYLGRALAQRGGFGLARIIAAGLDHPGP